MRNLGLVLMAMTMAAGGCDNQMGRRGGGGTDPGQGMPDMTPADPNGDADHDGYTPTQGDCDDYQSLVNPGAMEVVGNAVDDNCDGAIDEVVQACDSGITTSKKDAPTLAAALGLCDPAFLDSASFAGPSDLKARAVVKSFGILDPKEADHMVLLSTGLAMDKATAGGSFVKPQTGTDLGAGNEHVNPEPNLPAKMGCGMGQPSMVNDYSELVLKLKAPTNAFSFSFNFQFFSAEYPEFVCTMFNDMFLVEMETFSSATPVNIAFDEQKNPVTVNNGFFTICQNGSKPETMNCKKPVSDIAGTGYEDTDFSSDPIGGATGWLTTTAPVTPGEEITLRFIIFDEGDHIYDSSVLIDNFQWSVSAVDGPTTIQ